MKRRIHIVICVVLSSAAGLSGQRASADVVFEQVETVATGTFTSLDIPKPSGTVEDELLLAIVASEKSDAITSPAGWTLIDDGLDGDKGNSRTIVLYKVAGASEPALYTFTSSANKKAVGAILRYSGNDSTSPIDVSAAAPGSSSNPTAPGVTTTVDNTLVLRLFGAKSLPDPTDPFPPGNTGRFVIDQAGKVSAAGADAAQASAGATGTAAFLINPSKGWRAVTIAIVPGPCSIDADCDDGNECTTDVCNVATCEHTPASEGLACDDGSACNEGETCQTGVCTGGAPTDCSAAGDQCNTASCDPVGAEGNCDTLTPANEGLACDDGSACNEGETCQTGVCSGGAPPDCSAAGDQCNTASCDPVGVEGNCDTVTTANEGLACDDGVSCTDAVCLSGSCVFSNNAGQITVNVEIDALGPPAPPLARDVTFVITTCPGSVDIRVVPVAFDGLGSGTAVLDDIDSNSDWIQVTEGHTLAKLAPLSFVSCTATVNITGASQLVSGDLQTAIVAQDTLVDLVDFSILASNWNLPIDPTLSTGADATGDGVQGTADFTAIQINFFEFGDGTNGCARGGDGFWIAPVSGLIGDKFVPRSRIPIEALPMAGIEDADINGDGFIDSEDVRLFASYYDLVLLPDFSRKLAALEAMEADSVRGR